MWTLIIFAVSLGTVLWHYWCVKWSRRAKLLNLIPGPPTLPLIGNVLPFLVPHEKLWDVFREHVKKYFPICKIWSYSMCLVCLSDADDIEALLSSARHIKKGLIYEYARPWMNDGLVLSEGKKWSTRRKMIAPTFHFNILQEFSVFIIEEAQNVVQSLKETGEPVVKDLLDFFSDHTLNVICETAMGTSLNNLIETKNNYRKASNAAGPIGIYRYSRPWFHYDFTFELTPMSIKAKKVLDQLHVFTRSVIQKRKEYHESTNGIYLKDIVYADDDSGERQVKEEHAYGARKKRLAFLDLLIAAQRDNNQIDDEGIKEEVDTFMFEGYDTTATTLTFLFMCLAEHKEIQDRARAEINEVFQANDGKLTMYALHELHYLERCIKESQRLFPAAPYILRYLPEDLQLPKYVLPAKTEVMVSIFDVHRNPNYWSKPDVFDPDRFLPENCKGRSSFAFIPFSAGLRNCVGQKFAMMELKIVASYLLRNFYVECVDRTEDIRWNFNILLCPQNPVHARFVPIV